MAQAEKLYIPDAFQAKAKPEDYVRSPSVITRQASNLLSLYQNGVFTRDEFDPAREYFVNFAVDYLRNAQKGLHARASEFFPANSVLPDHVSAKMLALRSVTARDNEAFSHARQILTSIPEIVNRDDSTSLVSWKRIEKPKTFDQFEKRLDEMRRIIQAVVSGGSSPKQELVASPAFFRTITFFKFASEFSYRNVTGDGKIIAEEIQHEDNVLVDAVVDHVRRFRTMDVLEADLHERTALSIQHFLNDNREPDADMKQFEQGANEILHEAVASHLRRYKTGGGYERSIRRKRAKEIVEEIDIFLEEERNPKIPVRLNEPFSITPKLDGRVTDTGGYLDVLPVELDIPELKTTGRIQIRKRKNTVYGKSAQMPLGKPKLIARKNGDIEEIDPNSLGIVISLQLDNLGDEDEQTVRAHMYTAGLQLRAVPGYETSNGENNRSMVFDEWQDVEHMREPAEYIFPQDSKIFEGMKFVISRSRGDGINREFDPVAPEPVFTPVPVGSK